MLASNILKDDLPISAVVPKQASQETQYLDLISKILSTGSPRTDRTGTGTISIFAPTPLRFSLANNSFPLLTTKRVPARIV
jgi:thymidylate synthase